MFKTPSAPQAPQAAPPPPPNPPMYGAQAGQGKAKQPGQQFNASVLSSQPGATAQKTLLGQ